MAKRGLMKVRLVSNVTCSLNSARSAACHSVFQCCWDPTVDVGNGSHCFKPGSPINVGMAAGAAVAVTLVVIGIAAGGYFYYTKYGFGVPGSIGIANPNA